MLMRPRVLLVWWLGGWHITASCLSFFFSPSGRELLEKWCLIRPKIKIIYSYSLARFNSVTDAIVPAGNQVQTFSSRGTNGECTSLPFLNTRR